MTKEETIEQLLINSDKAELLEEFTKNLEQADRIIVMVEERTILESGSKGSQTYYQIFGFRQMYEVDGFIRQLHDEIMGND